MAFFYRRPIKGAVALCVFSFILIRPFALSAQTERGDLSVYFMGEKVGFEEYVWQETERGYSLTVSGRMTKPVDIEVERLVIEMDRSFIPNRYSFKGRMSGVRQEMTSVLTEGDVVNTIVVSGQEQRLEAKIRRDAFLLPNPIFSPYLVIAKKFGCLLQEKRELSAYLIPQMEASLTIEANGENSCLLLLDLNGTRIELETDAAGQIKALWIPSQNIRVTGVPDSSRRR